ncbi:5-(carboxyamino)imidazole ribonucleotide synthase [soil metagenome]
MYRDCYAAWMASQSPSATAAVVDGRAPRMRHAISTTEDSVAARVGMVGAGQLARMSLAPATALGIDLHLLAEADSDSAAQIARRVTIGDHRRPDDLLAFAKGVDVVTFDHELVAPEHLEALAAEGHVLRPAPASKRFAQDKRHQRERIGALGLPLPAFATVAAATEVEHFAEANGWPVVVKAARGGYDGRGVWVMDSSAEVAARWPECTAAGALLVEAFVTIERELAVLVARRPGGQAAVYLITETVQADGICHELLVPARVTPGRAAEATELGLRIAEIVDVAGVMAVELFETTDGLVINELACRPHNSGHWTIEGAATSQFANHLRAVLDWPLGSTALMADAAVTVNVLGPPNGVDPRDRLPAALALDGVSVHLYGKAARPGRKLGHVTVLGDDLADALSRARHAAALLTGEATS